MKITRQTEIEDLVGILPKSAVYLKDHGIKCLACGEPIWGTLEQAAENKGFGEKEIEKFVKDLNSMLNEG